MTAREGSRYIHSRYDPEKEALQLFDNFRHSPDYSPEKILFILEPGLGYLLQQALNRHDPSKIIVIFYSDETFEYCSGLPLSHQVPMHHPADGAALSDFLSPLAGAVELKELLFLELPSTSALYPENREMVRSEILKSLTINQGNEITKRRFARRWYLNGIRNFIHFEGSARIKSISGPVIITASGPTLEASLDSIAGQKERVIIAALPSSLAALRHRNIKPDILFTTDPGFYAREHLKHLDDETLLVSPMTSAVNRKDNTFCGLNQHSYIENLLIRQGEMEDLPEMGTVAATAVSFIMSKTDGGACIAGLDLCMSDISMHVRPHSFDPVILAQESRFRPGYGEYYKRACSMTNGFDGSFRLTKSLDTYSSWFSRQHYGDRIVRINRTPVKLPFKEVSSVSDFLNTAGGSKGIKIEQIEAYPDHSERRYRVLSLAQTLESELATFKEKTVPGPWLKAFAEEILPSEYSLFTSGRAAGPAPLMQKIEELISITAGVANGR